MQSRNFRLQKVGDLHWLEKNYGFRGIAFSLDELVVINATRGNKDISKFASMITALVDDVFIPITAGGGIRSVENAELLFRSGADKILLNTTLHENKDLVRELIRIYGSQSIVGCLDYKRTGDEIKVYIKDGSESIETSFNDYLLGLEALGIGEIYLNSIDKDGTGFGYDFEEIKKVAASIKQPLIIAGGAGNENHLIEGLKIPGVSAVATANLFNFIGNGLPNARKKILDSGENIACWEK